MAKLHPDTVRQLRRYHSHGYSVASLVDAFGLSRSCVHGVVSGKTHRNVSQDDALPPLAEIIRTTLKRRPDGTQVPEKQTGGGVEPALRGDNGEAEGSKSTPGPAMNRPVRRGLPSRNGSSESRPVCIWSSPPTPASRRTRQKHSRV